MTHDPYYNIEEEIQIRMLSASHWLLGRSKQTPRARTHIILLFRNMQLISLIPQRARKVCSLINSRALFSWAKVLELVGKLMVCVSSYVAERGEGGSNPVTAV